MRMCVCLKEEFALDVWCVSCVCVSGNRIECVCSGVELSMWAIIKLNA